MAWRIEFSESAVKQLSRLDRQTAQRIMRFLRERVAPIDDPRGVGAALRGEVLGKYWKYRVGNYRVICDIRDHIVTVIVVHIGHRREVYR
ncbi:MAG: type II toxin-antitoxin system RelE family toxin [Burkholderiales bacterium]